MSYTTDDTAPTASIPGNSRHATVVIVGAIAAVAAIGIGGHLLLNTFLDEHYTKHYHYATVSEAPTRGEATSFLPAWVPTDARSISLISDTRGRGKTVQLSTAGSGVRGDCTLTAAPSTDPFFSMQLPGEVRTASGLRCPDGWFVAQQGTHLYAWTVAAEREGGGLLN